MKGTRTAAPAVVFAAFLSACADDAPRGARSEDVQRLSVVWEADSDPGLNLSRVEGVAVDSRGLAYVHESTRIVVLNEDLTHRQTVGRPGDGPGDFNDIARIDVLAADSLFAYDKGLLRVTVFDPSTMDVAYTMDGPLGEGPDPVLAEDLFRLPGGPGYLGVVAGRDWGDMRDLFAPLSHIIVSVDGAGVYRDSVLLAQAPETLIADEWGGAASMRRHPFGHRSWVVPIGSHRFVHANSKRFEVEIFDIAGELAHSFFDPLAPEPVTRKQLNREAQPMGASAPALADQLRDGAPYTWPLLTGLVAGNFRDIAFWVGLRPESEDAPGEWAGFTEAAEYVASAFLPPGRELMAVRDGRMLAASVTELDVPRIHAYRLQ